MKIPKTKLTGLVALFISLNSYAQIKIPRLPKAAPVTNNELRINLQKVIVDFPNQFSNLRGDTLEVNPQTIEYASRLDFSMAPQNSIMEYRSLANPKYSWQANILTTEEFAEASNKYNWLYNQLKVMTIRTDGGYTFSLNGNYDKPDESRGFSSSIFKMTRNASNMPKLKVEISMQFEFPEWKVTLLVYEKEKEDADRADTME